MTYEQKAEVFRRSFGQDGDVVEALRAVARAAHRPAQRKLSLAQRTEARRRRESGEKWAAIASALGVCIATVRHHCRGVRLPPRPRPGADPRVREVAALVASELGLGDRWLAASRTHRGRVPGRLRLARQVAALALVGLGVPKREVGRQLFRDQSRVFETLHRAEEDFESSHLALLVTSRYETAQEQARCAA